MTNNKEKTSLKFLKELEYTDSDSYRKKVHKNEEIPFDMEDPLNKVLSKGMISGHII